MQNYLRSIFIVVLYVCGNSALAQTSVAALTSSGRHTSTTGFVSSKDVFGTRNFVENKGQFENPLAKQEKVLFVFEHAGEKIYFTQKGLIRELSKIPMRTEGEGELEDEEEERERERKLSKVERYYIRSSWVGANNNIVVDKTEEQLHYFTYGNSEFNAHGYKKITYKDVYAGIDIEYSLPSSREFGIKYNVIVHPNADANKVKMLYSGDVGKIYKTANGDIIIPTPMGNITEEVPASFQNNSELASEFLLNDDTLSFRFPSGYDHSLPLIVDPWVTTLTTLTSGNSGYDVDFDNAGNTYVYGGTAPFKIAKYNVSGTLQWTFGGTITSPSWNTTTYGGNFVVNKITEQVYTGQGCVLFSSGSSVVRLNNAGNYDNFITTSNSSYEEVWDMGLNCTTGELLVFGGSTTSQNSAASILPPNTSMNLKGFQPGNNICCHDVVSHAIYNQGALFVLYASYNNTSINNRICAVNAAMNGNLWTQPSGYSVMSESANKSSYTPYVNSNGFNALAVNSSYLFYYDGQHLVAYSKISGTILANITLQGLTVKAQGGIAVDACNHVFVGGNGSVLTYSFNGNSFTSLNSISLGGSANNVYDIKLDQKNNLLYVCGRNFAGAYSTTLTQNCSELTVPVTSGSVCAGQPITLTASGATNYTWSTGGTGASEVVSPNITTSYSVTAELTNVCGIKSGVTKTTVTVLPGPDFTVNSITICEGDKQNLSANGTETFSWSTGESGETISVSPNVTTTYTVYGIDQSMPCATAKEVMVTVQPCTGVLEASIDKPQMKIYPNPAHDRLEVSANGRSNGFILSLYNVFGIKVYSESLNFDTSNHSSVDIVSLPGGLYFACFQNGTSLELHKFVKQ